MEFFSNAINCIVWGSPNEPKSIWNGIPSTYQYQVRLVKSTQKL